MWRGKPQRCLFGQAQAGKDAQQLAVVPALALRQFELHAVLLAGSAVRCSPKAAVVDLPLGPLAFAVVLPPVGVAGAWQAAPPEWVGVPGGALKAVLGAAVHACRFVLKPLAAVLPPVRLVG